MKSFLAIILLLSVSFSYTHAGDEYETYEKKESTKMEDRQVISWDHGLELELENGAIEAEWNMFPSNAGFDWYKLVYSTTNSNPVYPDDKVVFIGSREQTETSFKLYDGLDHYVRLCAVILNDDYSKDRYCGAVHTFEREYVSEHKKEDSEDDSYEEKYEKEVVDEKKESSKKKIQKTAISAVMKNRIDTVIENFVEKLEDRGYSDAQMTSAIDTVISRLGEFKNKAGYREIVAYMLVVLEEYRNEYSNPLEDLETIFQGL